LELIMAHSEHKEIDEIFPKEIDFYYWPTPNGWKIEILLAELGIKHKIIPIDITKGDQFKPEFLKISPNNKIPAIVDPNQFDHEGKPLSVFESGAILIYFAQKTGKLLPDAKTDPAGNAEVHQWLMWQMAGLGPMFGQHNHFFKYAPEKIPYAIERYRNESIRLLRVLDTQIAKTGEYVSKSGYSIADIAIFGWVLSLHFRNTIEVASDQTQPVDVPEYAQPIILPEHVQSWLKRLLQRPVIHKLAQVYEAKARERVGKVFTDEERKILFNQK